MLSLFLSAGLILAAESDVGLKPSLPADIASAVGDCWKAVVPGAVDRALLARSGWSLVPETAAPGNPLLGYVKPGANHMIFLTNDPVASDYCTVIARLSSTADEIPSLEAMLQALKSLDPKIKPERVQNGIALVSLPRFAEVNPTEAAGATKEQPALRIIVGYHTAEPK